MEIRTGDLIINLETGCATLLNGITLNQNKQNMEKYNLNKLVKIEVLKRVESWMYKYKKYKKNTFFQPGVQEGFYRDFFGSKYINIDEVKSIVVIDFKVYIKDRVVLYFESGIKHTLYFDSYKNADTYAHTIEKKSRQNIITFN